MLLKVGIPTNVASRADRPTSFSLLQIVICLVAVAHVAIGVELKEEHEYGPVAYEFHYSVHDPHTGDIKSQKESRKDDKVEGSYELIDSDGHRRVVTYKSDDHNGFEAIVLREPTNIKIPIPEAHGKIETKIIAPVVQLKPAPLVHFDHKPAVLVKPAGGHGTFVTFSGPSHKYNY